MVYGADFEDSAIIVWKGMDRQYKENLGYLTCIDLSSNKLSGGIPVEITTLEGLRSLNLSRNSLTGPITAEIGNLNLLESLDLSNNQLIREIPPSFSSLNFLSVLNLSGKIPLSTQLQSFDANSYMENPQLCGSPLPKCQEGKTPAIITHYGSNEDVIVTPEFYVCMAIGFIVNSSWRHAYFQFLNQTKDRLYVAMVLNIAKTDKK
ncbi:hypothetical protein Ddye_011451 [Dipteronia dyeriana]|uniref:Uncharacterized protein n=1 Tax=Dipteronia dyeriana TaxID=168575 RepID=A0AAE0CH05_9ROSI|nr:hypothetical protein Ddye_011451 [Dipteronia dyeriana]